MNKSFALAVMAALFVGFVLMSGLQVNLRPTRPAHGASSVPRGAQGVWGAPRTAQLAVIPFDTS